MQFEDVQRPPATFKCQTVETLTRLSSSDHRINSYFRHLRSATEISGQPSILHFSGLILLIFKMVCSYDIEACTASVVQHRVLSWSITSVTMLLACYLSLGCTHNQTGRTLNR